MSQHNLGDHARAAVRARGLAGRKGGKGGGSGVGFAPYEAPNTLRSKQTARILDLISEGPTGGLVDGLKSIYFDDVPVQNADGTFNFQGVAVEERTGLPVQDHIPGFPAVETEIPVGTEVLFASPVTVAVVDAAADAVRVKVRIPNLSQFLPVGNTLVGLAVGIKIEVAPNGGPFATVWSLAIEGKTTSAYDREFRVPLPVGGVPWSVRLSRLSPDTVLSTQQNRTFFASYTIVTDAKLSYPDSALVALTVDAEQFGTSVPVRGYEYIGVECRIPDNYDPVTRVYTGIWGGAFTTATTDNPAWVLYELLTNTRWGLGHLIDPTTIDKFGLYVIAQYCDVMVDDGAGGEEPRFTFNHWLADAREAFQVVQTIVSAFLGMAYWSAGSLTFTQDSPADPAKLVSRANVIGGRFDYAGSSLRARHSMVLVTWNDPSQAYRAAVEVVEDSELIRSVGVRQLDVVATGCTSRSQAKRLGRWILDSERYATEAVQYEASLDHAEVRPGDVILVADPARAGVSYGGRLAAVASTVLVTADRDLPLGVAPAGWEFSVVLPDGSVETRDVVEVTAGPVVELASALSDLPLVGAMWILGEPDVEPRPFRVTQVTERTPNEYAVQAIPYDALKYARVEQGLRLEPPDYTTLPTGPLPAPGNLGVVEYLTRVAGVLRAKATVSWSPSRDGRVQFYEIEVLRPGANGYENLAFVSAVSVDLGDVEPGAYTLRVRAVSFLGQRSQFATLIQTLFGFQAPPSDVAFASVAIVGSEARMTWLSVSDLDLAGYEIRWHPDFLTAEWASASPLAFPGPRETTALLPALPGAYLIKAVDSGARESANAYIAPSPIDNLAPMSVIAEVAEDPTYPGVHAGTVDFDGTLMLDGGADGTMDQWATLDAVLTLGTGPDGLFGEEGTYTFDGSVDLDGVYQARVEPVLGYTVLDAQNVMAAWVTLAGVSSMAGESNLGDARVIFEVRVTPDDPTGAPIWGDWGEVVGAAVLTFWGLEARVRLVSLDGGVSTPLVTDLGVRVSLEVRTEAGDDLSSGDGPTFTYGAPFFSVPAFTATGQNLVVPDGEALVVSNKTRTGFDLEVQDSSGGPVIRIFDFVAVGVGRELV